MVEGAGMKCIKYLVFIFNILFLLAGLALIIIGAIAQAYQSSHFTGKDAINSLAIFILVIGGIIFIVAFFGCCGAIKENRCMLITFGILLIIVFILCVAAIIAAYVNRNNADSWLRDEMYKMVRTYDDKDTKQDTHIFWDTTQREQKCCGVDSLNDWKNNTGLSAKGSVPDSCCINPSIGCGVGYFNNATSSKNLLFSEGCYNAMKEGYKDKMWIVGGIAIGVAILMAIGIALAFGLAHAIHKGYNVV